MGARMKELLAQGRLVRVFGFGQLCYPKLIEMLGMGGGYDAVWLDQEHTGLTMEQIEHGVRAAHAWGLDSFVRLAPTDYATVMRPLEAGAGGIMAAQVQSAREAEQVVQWAKFHPRGQRGINSGGRDGHFGSVVLPDYMRRANAETFIAIQIEHVGALEEVEQIAAIPDVDVLFIGPADLSQSLGIPADWDQPRIWQAIERVARAAKAAKIHWGILPVNPAYARRCAELGCGMLSLGMDIWGFHRGLKTFKEDYAPYFSDKR